MLHFKSVIALLLCLAMAASLGGCKMAGADDLSRLVEDVKDSFAQPESYIPEESTVPVYDEPLPDETPTEAPEQTPSALVTDAYFDTIQDGEWFYCYHIPQVNLNDGVADAFNAKIYDQFYSLMEKDVYQSNEEYGYPMIENLVYTWGQKDDLLSIVIEESYTQHGSTSYYVYTISTVTGQEVADSDVYAAFGLDASGFYDAVKMTMYQYWDGQKDNALQMIDEGYFQSLVDKTVADSNVKASIPYINANGELCSVSTIYWFAGAEMYLHRFNTEQGINEGHIECTADHSKE